MKRKLLKQIATEWRSNLWLGIELMLISSILFYIFDLTASNIRMKNTFIGLDCTDVYRLRVGTRDASSPLFQKATPEAGETEEEAQSRLRKEEYASKLGQIRNMPGVIAAAPSSSAPYNYNYSGSALHFVGDLPDTVKKVDNYVNSYYVDTEFPKVFNIHGINGETPEQLSKMLEEGKIIITENTVSEQATGLKKEQLVNMKLTTGTDENEGTTYSIGALIPVIRRTDYEPPMSGTALQPSPGTFDNIYVRITPENVENFLNTVTNADAPINQGNTYILEAISMKTIRNDLHRNDDSQLRNMTICMGFLLLTVFLGLLGTFWFRTQQRVREIALRKTTGATNVQIFRRLMGEGLFILAIATIPALGLDALLMHLGMFFSRWMFPAMNPWITALIEAAIVFGFMAMMVIVGIYFPARKAMNVEPADTLRGE